MIYDCFMFFNELDLLEIRFNELKDVVDTFVICESTHTFTGLPKPLFLSQNRDRFSGFPIQLLIYDRPPDMTNPWANEAGQRNYLKTALAGCQDNDVIILTDADEIPTARFIESFHSDRICTIQMLMSYYFVNAMGSGENWGSAVAARWHRVKNMSMHDFRMGLQHRELLSGIEGNHFSYLGGMEAIRTKLASFSHHEYAKEFNTEENIRLHLGDLTDPFGRGEHFTVVDLDKMDCCPEYLKKHREKYRHLWL